MQRAVDVVQRRATRACSSALAARSSADAVAAAAARRGDGEVARPVAVRGLRAGEAIVVGSGGGGARRRPGTRGASSSATIVPSRRRSCDVVAGACRRSDGPSRGPAGPSGRSWSAAARWKSACSAERCAAWSDAVGAVDQERAQRRVGGEVGGDEADGRERDHAEDQARTQREPREHLRRSASSM